jgi:pimeloyl-ACP methyl ester carboxylesterase
MKKAITFLLFLHLCTVCIAQQSMYDYMPLGKYQVAYAEDVLYAENNTYEQFGYKGDAPIFVRIWHPVEREIKGKELSYHRFFFSDIPFQLKPVYQNLNTQSLELIFETVFKYNIENGEEIDYGQLRSYDLTGKLIEIKLKSKELALSKNGKYPVIIYHHGSQGTSIENVAMAEYFASRGYIFITANFHLPYVNQIYGLEESVKADYNRIKTINEYARNIAGKNPLIYIGHSWGAQVGWCYLHEPNWADAFISMETTIERKTDEAEIKDKWPFVYDVIKTKSEKFELPILMFANDPKDKKFSFFEQSNLARTYFVSPKIQFAHESYTSIFFTRYFLKETINVPDKIELENQLKSYVNHLELMDDFLSSVINKKSFKTKKYNTKFNIIH